MPTTPRLLIPYPAPNQTPWTSVFDSMVLAIDSSLYTPREDRNILIFGGGTMTFTASSGVLTWSAPISLLAAVTGFQWQIPSGQITLQDGQLFYITVARAPQTNTVYTPVVGSFTPNQPNGDNQILVGMRIGTVVHFRDGFLIGDGQSMLVFDNVSGGGGGGGGPVAAIPITTTGNLNLPEVNSAYRLESTSDITTTFVGTPIDGLELTFLDALHAWSNYAATFVPQVDGLIQDPRDPFLINSGFSMTQPGAFTIKWSEENGTWYVIAVYLEVTQPFSGNEDTDITVFNGTNSWALPELTVGTLTLLDGGLSSAAIVKQADTGSYQVTVFNTTAFPVFLQGFWDESPVGVVPVGGTALWCQVDGLSFGGEGAAPPSQVLTQNQMQLTAPAIIASSIFLPQTVVPANPLAQITAARTASFLRFQTTSNTSTVVATIPLPGTAGSTITELDTPGHTILDVLVMMQSTSTLDCLDVKMTWAFVVGTSGSPQAMGAAAVTGYSAGNSTATPQTAPVGWAVSLALDSGGLNILVSVTGDSVLVVDGSVASEWGDLQ